MHRTSCLSGSLLGVAALALVFTACSDDASPPDAHVGGGDGSLPTQDLNVPRHDSSGASKGLLTDHTAPSASASIPKAALDAARAKFGKIFYGHTSHGSQIVTGLDMLESEDGAKYAKPTLDEVSGDLGHKGDTGWVDTTKSDLGKANHGIKMVVWSWCGGASDNTTAGIDTYLSEMEKLEKAHPDIVFVYMTGHLDGSGLSGSLYKSNNQIRTYCKAHGKVLFDFADIESYDPSGKYYPDEDDSCGWCSTWCAKNTCPSCGDCAHSHCFNCYQKGKSFWWLLARLSGWAG